MAIDDAYIDVEVYKDIIGKTTDGEDAELDELAKHVSRWIEQKLGRIFNQSDANTVRYFDGTGHDWLWIDDLTSVDSSGIGIDTDEDGTFDGETFSTSAWCVLDPYNAAELSRPYTRLLLLPLSSNTTRTRWPTGQRSIKITGTWGWPAIPGVIKDLCAWRLRELRDLFEGGAAQVVEGIDAPISVTPKALHYFLQAERDLSRRRAGIV